MDVERIEVLKGPISALYGSGSVGGVVNVITRQGEFTDTPQWHGTVAGAAATNPAGGNTYGNVSYNSPDLWVYTSGKSYYYSFRHADGDAVHNSQFADWQGKLSRPKRQPRPGRHHPADPAPQGANEVGIPGKGLALPVGPDVTYPDTTRTLVSVSHAYRPENAILDESVLTVFYELVERRTRIDHYPAGPVVELRPEADHTTWGARWQNTLRLDPHTLVAGVDAWDWAYTGTRTRFLANGTVGVDAPLPDSRQVSAGIFAEDDWRLADGLTLNLGARMDSISATSDAAYDWVTSPTGGAPKLLRAEAEHRDLSWNAHAGITWDVRPHWSMTFVAASSYRTPDLLDRFKYLNLAVLGNCTATRIWIRSVPSSSSMVCTTPPPGCAGPPAPTSICSRT